MVFAETLAFVYYATPYPYRRSVEDLPEGRYTLKVRIQDFAGHADSILLPVVIDCTPPAFVVLEPADTLLNATETWFVNGVLSEPVHATLTFEDTRSGETHTLPLEGRDTVLWSGGFLEDGVYAVRLTLHDRAGNTAILEGPDLLKGGADGFRVDRTPPTIEARPFAFLGQPDTVLHVSVREADLPELRGSVVLEVLLDDSLVFTDTAASEGAWQVALDLSDRAPGQHVLTLKARDAAENGAEKTWGFAYRTWGVTLEAPSGRVPAGTVGVVGVVSDPDALQGGPLRRWRVAWREMNDSTGITLGIPLPGRWDTSRVTYVKDPLTAYTEPTLLATLDLSGLAGRDGVVLLFAEDSSFVLWDTAVVHVTDPSELPPQLALHLAVARGSSGDRPPERNPAKSGETAVLKPDEGDTLKVTYRYTGAGGRVWMTVEGEKGVVYEAGGTPLIGVEGIPPGGDGSPEPEKAGRGTFVLGRAGDVLIVGVRGLTPGAPGMLHVRFPGGKVPLDGGGGCRGRACPESLPSGDSTLTLWVGDTFGVRSDTVLRFRWTGPVTVRVMGLPLKVGREGVTLADTAVVIGERGFLWRGQYTHGLETVPSGTYQVKVWVMAPSGAVVADEAPVVVDRRLVVGRLGIQPDTLTGALAESPGVTLSLGLNQDRRVRWAVWQAPDSLLRAQGEVWADAVGGGWQTTLRLPGASSWPGGRYCVTVTVLPEDSLRTGCFELVQDLAVVATDSPWLFIPKRFARGGVYSGDGWVNIHLAPEGEVKNWGRYQVDVRVRGYLLPVMVDSIKVVYGQVQQEMIPERDTLVAVSGRHFVVPRSLGGRAFKGMVWRWDLPSRDSVAVLLYPPVTLQTGDTIRWHTAPGECTISDAEGNLQIEGHYLRIYAGGVWHDMTEWCAQGWRDPELVFLLPSETHDVFVPDSRFAYTLPGDVLADTAAWFTRYVSFFPSVGELRTHTLSLPFSGAHEASGSFSVPPPILNALQEQGYGAMELRYRIHDVGGTVVLDRTLSIPLQETYDVLVSRHAYGSIWKLRIQVGEIQDSMELAFPPGRVDILYPALEATYTSLNTFQLEVWGTWNHGFWHDASPVLFLSGQTLNGTPWDGRIGPLQVDMSVENFFHTFHFHPRGSSIQTVRTYRFRGEIQGPQADTFSLPGDLVFPTVQGWIAPSGKTFTLGGV